MRRGCMAHLWSGSRAPPCRHVGVAQPNIGETPLWVVSLHPFSTSTGVPFGDRVLHHHRVWSHVQVARCSIRCKRRSQWRYEQGQCAQDEPLAPCGLGCTQHEQDAHTHEQVAHTHEQFAHTHEHARKKFEQGPSSRVFASTFSRCSVREKCAHR
jgi:hypothetical protein